MSNNKKLITVFGATGNQGVSVINHLLEVKDFTLRGVCRHVDEPEAKAFKSKGVQMVVGDIEKNNVDDLANIMKGSYGVFLMTNFWDPSSMNKEEMQGRKLVDAARKVGVKHLIWSTLPNVEKLSGLDVPHFTDKAKVEEYIREIQKRDHPFEVVAFVAPSFYYQNFRDFIPPKEESGTLVFTLPNTQSLISMNIDEMGLSVRNIIKSPKQFDMKRIDYYGTQEPLQRYVDDFQKATGLKARLNMVSHEEYLKIGQTHAKEVANMFKWFDRMGYYGPESDRAISDLATEGKLSSFGEWAKTQNWTNLMQRKA
jgi:uncharacterized protein YbjT (DUF2867 family)